MAITLLQLKTQARERADMVDSDFVEDSELTSYINNSIAELHDLMLEAHGEMYHVESYDFTTASGTASYALPDDFYRLLGVDVKINGSDWLTISRFNFNERNRFEDIGVWDYTGTSNIRYRLVGNEIRFSPIPNANVDARLWYVPTATKLVDDTDEMNEYNGYSEYIIVDVAIKMLQKEETDVSVLMAQKMQLEKRIRDAAQTRDIANPESISDIYASNDDYYWRRS
ncbi:MAG: hypothetical protein FMNOHCHN_03734 [Ignavibacteriaceae bacterium]|nr:hypothetical protein [Ignavibacteriaceae bacterium]